MAHSADSRKHASTHLCAPAAQQNTLLVKLGIKIKSASNDTVQEASRGQAVLEEREESKNVTIMLISYHERECELYERESHVICHMSRIYVMQHNLC